MRSLHIHLARNTPRTNTVTGPAGGYREHDLTIPMALRRFARLTNAFSKYPQNHAHMVALYALWYKFVRVMRDCG